MNSSRLALDMLSSIDFDRSRKHERRAALALLLAFAVSGCAGIGVNGHGPASSQPKSEPPETSAPATASLIGKAGGDLVALLGQPGLVRRDKGVEVWQYAASSCVLLFYLYADPSGEKRVTYLEAMPQGISGASPAATAITPDACLAEQLRAGSQKGAT